MAEERPRERSSSFFKYCLAQFSATDLDSPQPVKHERVYNFLSVPTKLEKFLFLGYVICLDAFLFNFTILPLRIVLSTVAFVLNSFVRITSLGLVKTRLPYSGQEIWKGLMFCACYASLINVNSSRLYHSIRGQSALKLYVIYNVLEVADKLFCSFGLDILDSFYSQQTQEDQNSRKLRPAPHFLVAVIYLVIHSVILLYQVITLNVAINSYSNALLTLLLSNQFVELKSAVFKKFEKENLFQLSCADVVERFQLSLYLIIIGLRNLSEMRNSLDQKFLIDGLLIPLLIVYLSEIAVDWLKHCFITKFNHIPPEVYAKFITILAKDFDTVNEEHNNRLADKSPQFVRVLVQAMDVYSIDWTRQWPFFCLAFASALLFKLILGVNIAAYSQRKTDETLARSGLKRQVASSSQLNVDEPIKSQALRPCRSVDSLNATHNT